MPRVSLLMAAISLYSRAQTHRISMHAPLATTGRYSGLAGTYVSGHTLMPQGIRFPFLKERQTETAGHNQARGPPLKLTYHSLRVEYVRKRSCRHFKKSKKQ